MGGCQSSEVKVDAGSVRREAVRRPGISNRSSSLYAPDMMSDEGMPRFMLTLSPVGLA